MVLTYLPFADAGLTGRRVLGDLDQWLNTINPDLGKKKRPNFKELWKAGDLHEKLAAVNAKISSILARWEVRKDAQVSEMTCADHHHHDQRQLQANMFLLLAGFKRQEGPVRQQSRRLSMYSQVEPADFNGQPTRVGHHPRL